MISLLPAISASNPALQHQTVRALVRGGQVSPQWQEVAGAEGFAWLLCIALESYTANLASLLVVASLWLVATHRATLMTSPHPAAPAGRLRSAASAVLRQPLVPVLALLGCVRVCQGGAWRGLCERLESLTAPSYCRGVSTAEWRLEAEPSEESSESSESSEPLAPSAESLRLTSAASDPLAPSAGNEASHSDILLQSASEVSKEARPRSLARYLRGGVEVVLLAVTCVLF